LGSHARKEAALTTLPLASWHSPATTGEHIVAAFVFILTTRPDDLA
jgi:hypothetical protein